MSEPLRALTLVSCENNEIILHEDVLKKVLESEKAKNRSVAVISIAGKLRKGKSFFLNFVLRYLKAERDPDWISPEAGPLTGFEWKPSRTAVTSGITIWPEVFVVNDVAVVLVDTQGLFDTKKNTKEETFIMVISALFSSYLILNYQERLDSLDLKHFEYFSKYGMELENATQENATQNGKAFQNLLFLMRDWIHIDDHSFGLEGGKEYLDYFIKEELCEELSFLPTSLRLNFEQVECFLTPHPGETVAQSTNFIGDMNNIKPIFLENLKTLVENMIGNVKPKKVLGIEKNGRCLLQFMIRYVEVLNSGELPEPKSLIQLQWDVLQKHAENECLEIYNDNMREGTKNQLLNKSEMEKLHKECATAALGVFDRLPKFGNEKGIKTAKSKFSKMLYGNEFGHYKSTMEEKVTSKLREILNDCESTHTDRLDSGTESLLNSQDLEALIADRRTETLDHFMSNTTFGDAEGIQEFRALLAQSFSNKESMRREDMKQRVEAHYSQLLDQCKLLYKKLMDERMKSLAITAYLKFWEDAITEKHNEIKRLAKAEFDGNLEVHELQLSNNYDRKWESFTVMELARCQSIFEHNRSHWYTGAIGGTAATAVMTVARNSTLVEAIPKIVEQVIPKK